MLKKRPNKLSYFHGSICEEFDNGDRIILIANRSWDGGKVFSDEFGEEIVKRWNSYNKEKNSG